MHIHTLFQRAHEFTIVGQTDAEIILIKCRNNYKSGYKLNRKIDIVVLAVNGL